MRKTWRFKHEGIEGFAERTHNACFICWGGVCFHLIAANDLLRDAILQAEPA